MRVFLGFVIAVLYSLPVHAEALDGNAIKATFFNGQPFIASSPTRQRYTMVFTPDGKATREPLGKAGDKIDGKWKVVKEGFCTQWKDGPTNCYRLVTCNDRRRQMGGDEGRDHGRELEQAAA